MAVLLERQRKNAKRQSELRTVHDLCSTDPFNKYLGQSKYLCERYKNSSIHGYPDRLLAVSQELRCADHLEAGRAAVQDMKFASC